MAYKATGLVVVHNPAACKHFRLQNTAWQFLTESWNVYVQPGYTARKYKLCLMYSIVSSIKTKSVVWALLLHNIQNFKRRRRIYIYIYIYIYIQYIYIYLYNELHLYYNNRNIQCNGINFKIWTHHTFFQTLNFKMMQTCKESSVSYCHPQNPSHLPVVSLFLPCQTLPNLK